MSATGSLHTVINALTKGVKSTFRPVATTIVTTFTICACTANGTLPLLLCGDAFKEEYKKRGLAAKNLSRTTEDAGTVVEPIIPWSASGVYCATMLGVPRLIICHGQSSVTAASSLPCCGRQPVLALLNMSLMKLQSNMVEQKS
jgi:Na+/H+ antiporter NhaC